MLSVGQNNGEQSSDKPSGPFLGVRQFGALKTPLACPQDGRVIISRDKKQRAGREGEIVAHLRFRCCDAGARKKNRTATWCTVRQKARNWTPAEQKNGEKIARVQLGSRRSSHSIHCSTNQLRSRIAIHIKGVRFHDFPALPARSARCVERDCAGRRKEPARATVSARKTPF